MAAAFFLLRPARATLATNSTLVYCSVAAENLISDSQLLLSKKRISTSLCRVPRIRFMVLGRRSIWHRSLPLSANTCQRGDDFIQDINWTSHRYQCLARSSSQWMLAAHGLSSRATANGRPPAVRQGSAWTENEKDGIVEKKGKNQRKREAQKSRDLGVELTKLSKKEVDMVISFADLDRELAPAVALAKVMARDDGRRRQMNFIGGLLRGVDPALVETAIKAAKEGNLGGYLPLRPSGDAGADEGGQEASGQGGKEEDFEEEEDEEENDEESEEVGSERITRWMEGLLSSSSDVQSEVYSLIRETSLDRQDLRRLLRAAQQELAETSQADGEVNEVAAIDDADGQGASGDRVNGPSKNKARPGHRQLAEFLMLLEDEIEVLDKDQLNVF